MSIINNFPTAQQDTAIGVKQFNTPNSVTMDGSNYVFNFDFEFNNQIDVQFNLRGASYNSVTEITNTYLQFKNGEKQPVEGLIRNNRYYHLLWVGDKWVAKLSTFGISTAPIVITTSGTYAVEPGITYRCVAVGGGGAYSYWYYSYYGEYENVAGGGAGGKIDDTFAPTSSTITVTIGASGGAGVRGWEEAATGNSGGDTIVDKYFVAKGGSGGTVLNSSDSRINGTGGSYSGGAGEKGQDATFRAPGDGYKYGDGGQGWYVNGAWYGRGGSCAVNPSYSYSMKNQADPTGGVVMLTPVIDV